MLWCTVQNHVGLMKPICFNQVMTQDYLTVPAYVVRVTRMIRHRHQMRDILVSVRTLTKSSHFEGLAWEEWWTV